MTDKHNIWHRLQEHEVAPPPELRSRLLLILKQETGEDSDMADTLKGLAGYAIQPPVNVRETVFKNIREHKSIKGRIRQMKISPALIYRYTGIAAGVLLLLAGWMIYSFYHKKPSVKIVAVPANIISDTTGVAQAQPEEVQPDSVRAVAKRKGGSYRPVKQVLIDGKAFVLENNDLLISFAAYWDFDDGDEDIPLQIKLDEYTNITISDKMMQILRDMYSVKRNGKKTRKAKRSMVKLEKWKKSDEQYFDDMQKNPLNPVDMADFIFK